MSSVLVQFRTEDTAKAKTTSICDRYYKAFSTRTLCCNSQGDDGYYPLG